MDDQAAGGSAAGGGCELVEGSGAGWSVRDSGDLYRVGEWGPPCFFINAEGHAAVRPEPGAAHSIDLARVVRRIRRRNVEGPLLIRFPDILRAQVRRLHDDFRAALAGTGYGGAGKANGAEQDRLYRAVYPVKVNPLRHVMEEILAAGRACGMGLECGSRAELAAALPHLGDRAALLVCNGVKDAAMLELILDAQRLGGNAIPVVQSLDEFQALRSVAARCGAEPAFGVRIRPSAAGGADSKFGLSAAELMMLIEQSRDSLGRLRLVHVHPGSQVDDLARVRRAAREAAQAYAWLSRQGAGLRYLDVGGGLGVNYGGCGAAQRPNYTPADYATTVAATVGEVCRSQGVEVPVLVTETGRAVTAAHAVLIVPILGVRERPGLPPAAALPPHAHKATAMLFEMARRGGKPHAGAEALARLAHVHGCYRDVCASFAEGVVPMEEYALAERACVTASRRLFDYLRGTRTSLPPELRTLEDSLADRILCDFSVFQSIPDHWACGHAFPIMPIDGLDRHPSRRGVLVDLTCDADGKVDRYVGSDTHRPVLAFHRRRPGDSGCLGVFLVGAYEDVIGDNHNLFGRVSEAHVRADGRAPEGFRIETILAADTVGGMTAQMRHKTDDLKASMRKRVEMAVASGALPPEAGRGMVERYTDCLKQGTYIGAGEDSRPRSGAGIARSRASACESASASAEPVSPEPTSPEPTSTAP